MNFIEKSYNKKITRLNNIKARRSRKIIVAKKEKEIKIKYCTYCKCELNKYNKHKRYLCCKECRKIIHTKRYIEIDNRAYRIYDSARRRSKSKNIDFAIELADIKERLENGHCEVSGIPFFIGNTNESFKIHPFSPSLDRIDNSKGYLPDNIKLVCFIYNVGKNRYELDIFNKFVYYYYNHNHLDKTNYVN